MLCQKLFNYDSLGIKSAKSTSMVLQLADRSLRHPFGIVEDVLVKVKNLVFPADFYVLDMDSGVSHDTTLILGRSFLRTANTLISMKDGLITMEVGDQKIQFNMYETMKYPNEDYSLLGLNVVNVYEIDDGFWSSPDMYLCDFKLTNDDLVSPFLSLYSPPDVCTCGGNETSLNYSLVDCTSRISPPNLAQIDFVIDVPSVSTNASSSKSSCLSCAGVDVDVGNPRRQGQRKQK